MFLCLCDFSQYESLYCKGKESPCEVVVWSASKKVRIIKCGLKSPNGILSLYMFHLEFSISSKNAVLSSTNN